MKDVMSLSYIYSGLIMFLIRVRNDLLWIFGIKKCFQLVKTIRLSTLVDIFVEKKIQNFVLGRGVKKSFFRFNDAKSTENVILKFK